MQIGECHLVQQTGLGEKHIEVGQVRVWIIRYLVGQRGYPELTDNLHLPSRASGSVTFWFTRIFSWCNSKLQVSVKDLLGGKDLGWWWGSFVQEVPLLRDACH